MWLEDSWTSRIGERRCGQLRLEKLGLRLGRRLNAGLLRSDAILESCEVLRSGSKLWLQRLLLLLVLLLEAEAVEVVECCAWWRRLEWLMENWSTGELWL